MNVPYQTIYTSPLGEILISADEHYITKIHFLEEEEKRPAKKSSPLLTVCMQQLNSYFAGSLKNFDLPISQEGTQFQQKVWKALLDVPFGKTSTYLQLSKKIGNMKAIRAVGAANGQNDIAIVVPCHRITGSNGSLVGYAGGLWRKKWLLQHEGKTAGGMLTLF